MVNKYLAWGVWHSTNDPRLWGDPLSQLNNPHARQDTNEQFPVQRTLHALLIHDRLYLMGLTAICISVHFSSVLKKRKRCVPEKNNISSLDRLDVAILDNLD
jgi:hypothetical protein